MAGTATLRLDSVPGLGRTLIFPIENEVEAPAVTASKYIFFGRVSITLQAAPGVGIVTSVVLQSDDLDEITWEWVGGDNAHVQTVYFSKGNTETNDRVTYVPVKDPLSSLHTYTVQWYSDKLEWMVDDVVVRTLVYNEADNGKPNGYPQAPMVLKVGTWVAGKKTASQGTIDWAGGLADFSKGPFNAYVKNITMEDHMKGARNATQYRYLDQTGWAQNIKVEALVEGENDTVVTSTGGPPESSGGSSVSDGNSGGSGLGAGGIAGIVGGFVAAIAVIATLVFVLLRQRKKRNSDDVEKPGTPAVDEDKAVGVDAKMELDGTTFVEMSADLPPPKEMDGQCEMRKELDADCEIPAEVEAGFKDVRDDPDVQDTTGKDANEIQEEIYELMVHEPGDELIPHAHELLLPSPLTPSQGPDSPTIDRLPSPLSPDSVNPGQK